MNYDGYTDKLPGFHFQGNRYPVLSNFAGLVRNNEFKIRSVRVINELNTWIFKGETARIDHMEGAHDDTLCALAMGLFVMQYTVNRIQNTQNNCHMHYQTLQIFQNLCWFYYLAMYIWCQILIQMFVWPDVCHL